MLLQAGVIVFAVVVLAAIGASAERSGSTQGAQPTVPPATAPAHVTTTTERIVPRTTLTTLPPTATTTVAPTTTTTVAPTTTTSPPPPPPPPTTVPAQQCTPGYDPCIPPGPDVDCAGGSGNGPRYVDGPVYVSGSDPYGLDSDGDGVGCES